MVPLCEQLRAQHKRAVETSGVRLAVWAAFLQQSIPAMPGMLHSCSLEWSGTPETAPPASINKTTNDVIRALITLLTVGKWPIPVNMRLAHTHISREIVRICRLLRGFDRSLLRRGFHLLENCFHLISELSFRREA